MFFGESRKIFEVICLMWLYRLSERLLVKLMRWCVLVLFIWERLMMIGMFLWKFFVISCVLWYCLGWMVRILFMVFVDGWWMVMG